MDAIITDRVLAIIMQNLELEMDDGALDFDDDQLLIGINSINFIRTVVALETEFGIEFNDEEIDYGIFRTVNTLVEYVENQLKRVS
jgi:acyl carrier protein